MRTENRPVSSKIIEVIHNDGHEQVNNLNFFQTNKSKTKVNKLKKKRMGEKYLLERNKDKRTRQNREWRPSWSSPRARCSRDRLWAAARADRSLWWPRSSTWSLATTRPSPTETTPWAHAETSENSCAAWSRALLGCRPNVFYQITSIKIKLFKQNWLLMRFIRWSSAYLHADDSVNEEQHDNQENYVG